MHIIFRNVLLVYLNNVFVCFKLYSFFFYFKENVIRLCLQLMLTNSLRRDKPITKPTRKCRDIVDGEGVNERIRMGKGEVNRMLCALGSGLSHRERNVEI